VRRCALLAPYDKTGLAEFARGLSELGFELVATGNTQRVLSDAGLAVTPVSELTGFPEMMDGRVKTLHPAVHGGILARRDSEVHMAALSEHGFAPIDVVAVNLYPFAATVAAGAPAAECIEQIDIGGPAMLRAAAKNHASVTVIVDPSRYPEVLQALRDHGQVPRELRRTLAARAFAHTAAYDATVAAWMRALEDPLPEELTVSGVRVQTLRYGENPHQSAALYRTDPVVTGIAGVTQLQGKDLSYNNLVDAASAWELAAEFSEPAVAIIKHTNPAGCAVSAEIQDAYRLAHASDPVSAYGGVVAVNRTVDGATAELMSEIFLEVIAAPGFEQQALETLSSKRNLRLLRVPPQQPLFRRLVLETVPGGFLAQTPDAGVVDEPGLRVVTRRAPTAAELRSLRFAWTVCKHVRSNAIVLAREQHTVGVGAGQMNRVNSVRLATAQAQERAGGAVMASDAFFPFADGVEAAAEAGVTAVMQPGGSVRDEEVIAAADAAGMAMVFTGMRHFRH
jgi:phosphoribosylaminoimidazolecarboxamide formyltransferase/IMP cyclohydrolase